MIKYYLLSIGIFLLKPFVYIENAYKKYQDFRLKMHVNQIILSEYRGDPKAFKEVYKSLYGV